MPGVKKSNDVELQLHESDATDQTEVSHKLVFFTFDSNLCTAHTYCTTRYQYG